MENLIVPTNHKQKPKKTKILCAYISLIGMILIWLLLPPLLGCYYFEPFMCLDGSTPIIIIAKKESILMNIGESTNNYSKRCKLKNELLIIKSGEYSVEMEVKNHFFWITWQNENTSVKDDKQGYNLPCYNPIIFFQAIYMWCK